MKRYLKKLGCLVCCLCLAASFWGCKVETVEQHQQAASSQASQDVYKRQSLFSDDYGVLVLYVNENDEYVDSFVFTRKENLPGTQDKNGWVPLGSGSLTTDEDFLAQYSKDGDLSKYITGLGLKNTSRLILTTAIPYLPTCIYFVQENEEFLLPLEDGRAGIQGLQVYRMSDIVETFLTVSYTHLDVYKRQA